MPRRWHQVGGSISAGDGGKQARSPGRARRKPLKPLRGECRAAPVNLYLVCYFIFARETAGAARTRHSLRPLFSRVVVAHNSGVFTPRERGGVCAWLFEIPRPSW